MKEMLSILLLLLLAVTAMPFPLGASTQQTAAARQTQSAALTDKDIPGMVKSGLAQEIIIAKIKSSATNFDASPAALQELKAGGVPLACSLGLSADRP